MGSANRCLSDKGATVVFAACSRGARRALPYRDSKVASEIILEVRQPALVGFGLNLELWAGIAFLSSSSGLSVATQAPRAILLFTDVEDYKPISSRSF